MPQIVKCAEPISTFRRRAGSPHDQPGLAAQCNLLAAFFGIVRLASGADLTFATMLTVASQSERQIQSSTSLERTRMKRTIAIAALGLSQMSSTAMAEERSTDAALGVVSGAVVLGPVGAVAGALVGFTAGPSISRSWGLRRSSVRRERRKPATQEAHPTAGNGQPAPGKQPSAPTAASAPPASHSTASSAPPVQTFE